MKKFVMRKGITVENQEEKDRSLIKAEDQLDGAEHYIDWVIHEIFPDETVIADPGEPVYDLLGFYSSAITHLRDLRNDIHMMREELKSLN